MDLVTNQQEQRVAAILEHVTIFEVFERMGVDVPHETHQMKCPFHKDNSPSARVYAEQNKIYCFTCQKSWDVIAAAQDHLTMLTAAAAAAAGVKEPVRLTSFAEALVWLEQEFSVPGGKQSLTGSIRTQLASRTAPDVRLASELVEQTLKARRGQLGFDRYTRCLLALDLTVYEVAEKRLKPVDAQGRFQAILRAAAV